VTVPGCCEKKQVTATIVYSSPTGKRVAIAVQARTREADYDVSETHHRPVKSARGITFYLSERSSHEVKHRGPVF